jgi:hypothetical protein
MATAVMPGGPKGRQLSDSPPPMALTSVASPKAVHPPPGKKRKTKKKKDAGTDLHLPAGEAGVGANADTAMDLVAGALKGRFWTDMPGIAAEAAVHVQIQKE